jgi:hypothetical protein
MSYYVFADYAFELSWEEIAKHCPKEIEALNAVDSEYLKNIALEDDLDNEENKEIYDHINASLDKIKEWGKSEGLDIDFAFRVPSDDNYEDEDDEDGLPNCYFYVENAYTINPAFKKFNGKLKTWVCENT